MVPRWVPVVSPKAILGAIGFQLKRGKTKNEVLVKSQKKFLRN
jgi:hypothetical protein